MNEEMTEEDFRRDIGYYRLPENDLKEALTILRQYRADRHRDIRDLTRLEQTILERMREEPA